MIERGAVVVGSQAKGRDAGVGHGAGAVVVGDFT